MALATHMFSSMSWSLAAIHSILLIFVGIQRGVCREHLAFLGTGADGACVGHLVARQAIVELVALKPPEALQSNLAMG